MELMNNTEDLTSSRGNIDYELDTDKNPAADNITTKVAEGLKNAAASLKEKAPQHGVISDYASHASGWLDQAADYVQDIKVSRVKSDIQRQMRTNPGRSLLIAGAVGLIVGTLFRRR